jgi:CDP-diacylglycerol---glycerol-3-phosphate 3-phosphatidyltransferase
MFNLSNILSLSRAGFALAFLQSHVWLRLLAIVLAMISDFLDGYIARRQRTVTQFGAILDPLMDKFFVFLAAAVFYLEGRLNTWELVAIGSRDIALCCFGLYLGLNRGWRGYECKAIWWGKTTTVSQFILLIGLTLNMVIPIYVYLLFVAMGAFAFLELMIRHVLRKTN